MFFITRSFRREFFLTVIGCLIICLELQSMDTAEKKDLSEKQIEVKAEFEENGSVAQDIKISDENLKEIFNYLLCEAYPIDITQFEGRLYDYIKMEKKFLSEQKIKPDFLSDEKNGYMQKIIVSPNSHINCIGDIHGSRSLLRLILKMILLGKISCPQIGGLGGVLGPRIIDPNEYIIFTGDIGDRGKYSIEDWFLIIMLKLFNWDNVFIVRGNHEASSLGLLYGFYDDLKKAYGEKGKDLWEIFNAFWALLPSALCIGNYVTDETPNFLFVCHGGLPCNKNDDQVVISKSFMKALTDLQKQKNMLGCALVADDGFQLRWNDFSLNKVSCFDSIRGYAIGTKLLQSFFQQSQVAGIIRGHQDFISCGLIGWPVLDAEYEDYPIDWYDFPNITNPFPLYCGIQENKLGWYAPVVTISTSVPERHKIDGFITVNVGKNSTAWSVKVSEYEFYKNRDIRQAKEPKQVPECQVSGVEGEKVDRVRLEGCLAMLA